MAETTKEKDERSEYQKSTQQSTDQWRAMQGLPPIDRSQEARHPKGEPK